MAGFNPEASFTFLASPACPPITGIRIVHDRLNCNGFIEKALQFADARHFNRIMFVARWYAYFDPAAGWMCFETGGGCHVQREPSSYFQHLDAALAILRARLLEFRNRGAEIVMVGATPWDQWNVPVELAKRKFLGMDTKDIEYIDRFLFEKKAAPIKSRLIALASSIGGKFVDPLNFLCDSRRCPTVDEDGVPYFMDEQHVRSSTVKTARFQFLDDAVEVNNRLSAVPMALKNTP
jgi:SGNH domain (fused to AT3 domains)